MAQGFDRPVAVFGPHGRAAAAAAKYLRRRGLVVESLIPTPGNMAEFMHKRGGLVVWVDDTMSLRDHKRMREARKWQRNPVGDRANSFHGWWAAQVVVPRTAGRTWFYRWLRQLLSELTYPEHLRFMTWVEQHGQMVLASDGQVGSVQWQLYVMTKPPPRKRRRSRGAKRAA